MPMPAVVLAAGRSTRMGQPKALLPATRAGETFIERLVSTLIAGGIDDVVVVAGDVAAAIRTRLGFRARVVANPDVDRGQLSSIVVGLDVVDRPGVLAVMIAPVDQPLVSETTVRALADAWRRNRAPIVRPVREGRHGHPVIFDRAVFDELRTADLSKGARAVVHAHAENLVEIAVDDDGAFANIDTPADYERWTGLKL
ncbi:MAG TPA: nucleotidyltransferase family protein [Vicinamibacterales bacterium]|jgi:molybdenum cofactor cytidylyltransferase|nr:nucleotidyltransferase family protein [Vicinamibacterales bacterium]